MDTRLEVPDVPTVNVPFIIHVRRRRGDIVTLGLSLDQHLAVWRAVFVVLLDTTNSQDRLRARHHGVEHHIDGDRTPWISESQVAVTRFELRAGIPQEFPEVKPALPKLVKYVSTRLLTRRLHSDDCCPLCFASRRRRLRA